MRIRVATFWTTSNRVFPFSYKPRDLIFPHHENELAQSAAAAGPCCSGQGPDFVRYWVHNGFVNVDRCVDALGG